ncbi:hypothetical protein Daura_06145 [Dactylosporangium aurantiacum]|uniref:Uncharacterized protein n=1 Tax=Dactylosporangium aurantiacum TaxID=35754 RepID=A0A9Q9MNJ6_9ACTN|nr:hypothetical protein [Dactylosporangium aurantiacum]MDG6108812.1 hypothetical protein [Dactylosporangium aurantiacum]UWZ55782.1 hypothetical protein Daura_06145 [Dactylosporangium aurantiacum]
MGALGHDLPGSLGDRGWNVDSPDVAGPARRLGAIGPHKQKIVRRESGWAYPAQRLIDNGGRPPRGGEDLPGWLESQLPAAVARRERHGGSVWYLLPLAHFVAAQLPRQAAGAYPKRHRDAPQHRSAAKLTSGRPAR